MHTNFFYEETFQRHNTIDLCLYTNEKNEHNKVVPLKGTASVTATATVSTSNTDTTTLNVFIVDDTF